MKTIIVGGVAGGASAAARLRRLDEQAEIILIERGAHVSFANCGLPYYIGGDISKKSSLLLQTPESLHARFNIDVRTHSEVVAVDPSAQSVSIKNLKSGEEYVETYDNLILSPGAKPSLPPIEGVELDRVFTLRSVPDAVAIRDFVDEEFPDHAVIIGGGYIGLEMAENLKKTGMSVTIVEMSDHVIAPLDFDITCDVHAYLESKGVSLLLNTAVEQIAEEDDGLSVKTSCGAISCDFVILSAGVTPDTAFLKGSGIPLNARGAILTDSHMRALPHVYAVGDAVAVSDFILEEPTLIPLAGPANKQGRIAADNICGIPSEYHGTQGSSVLKLFDMTIAMSGANERALRQSKYDYDKVFLFTKSHAAYYPGAQGMSIKALYEKATGRILGAQITGFDGVDKRMDVLSVAIRQKMTAQDLTELELCYAPPFGSAKDPVNFVGYVIENTRCGLVKTFHWHDIASLPRDGSVTLLDVRTDAEYAEGHIDGFSHIPLDSLRGRIDELDPQKPVYVHCHSGLRSYIACRILRGNGFDCYNLSGGYRLYHNVMTGKKMAEHPCYPKSE